MSPSDAIVAVALAAGGTVLKTIRFSLDLISGPTVTSGG
jgi:hypothetical protein